MNINTNIQSFSSQSGIKVTQNGNSNQSIDKNKNSEAVNINMEDKQNIIKDAINLKEFSFKGIKSEADSLLEKYGSKDMELIKLLLMQKYLMGKEDSEADKEFYKLLKEWEESKTQE